MVSRVKISDVLARVRACVAAGSYFDTYHSALRQGERNISRGEILYVLTHGWHERSKDRFDLRYSDWNYAIRGRTLDGVGLRVVVAFDLSGMLIITAIKLDD